MLPMSGLTVEELGDLFGPEPRRPASKKNAHDDTRGIAPDVRVESLTSHAPIRRKAADLLPHCGECRRATARTRPFGLVRARHMLAG